MNTTADKLKYLLEAKDDIKNAIENKDVPVPSGTTLKQYADLINKIYPDALFLRKKDTLGNLPKFSLFDYYTEASYGNNVYVVIADSPNYCAVKEQGKEWTVVGTTGSSGGEGSIAFGNGYFVVAECDLTSNTMNRNYICRSSDGKSWSKITLPNNIPRGKVIFAKNNFFLFPSPRQDISKTLVSTDGSSWSKPSVSNGGTTETGVVAFDKEQGVFYRVKTGVFLSSNDGLTWTKKYTQSGISSTKLEYICAGNGTIAYTSQGVNSFLFYDNFTKNKRGSSSFNPSAYFNGFFLVSDSVNLVKGIASIVPAYFIDGNVEIIKIPLPGTIPHDTLNPSYIVVANGIAFTGSAQVTYYSSNLLFWSKDKIVYFADTKGNDVTVEVFEKISFISADLLNAAYTLGVNSYA